VKLSGLKISNPLDVYDIKSAFRLSVYVVSVLAYVSEQEPRTVAGVVGLQADILKRDLVA
jgi:hydroxymethylpyrimidine/phosphomethylpyrimidine kinase